MAVSINWESMSCVFMLRALLFAFILVPLIFGNSHMKFQPAASLPKPSLFVGSLYRYRYRHIQL